MRLFFATHNKALAAEWQKLKRTGTFWLTAGIAVFVPVLSALVQYMSTEARQGGTFDTFVEGSFTGFTGFFFPLYLIIVTVRIVNLEHRSDTWKLMDTQPVSRFSLYLVKFEVLIILSLFTLVALLLFAVAGGLFLQVAIPKSTYKFSGLSWGVALAVLFRYWIASFGLIAIQLFLSLLTKNFSLPVTLGLVAVIAGSILASVGLLNWFPYAAIQFTSASYRGSDAGSYLLPHEIASLLWMVLFLASGYFYHIKRGFSRAFLQPIGNLVASVLVLSLAIFLVWWVNRPVVLAKYGRTVIDGIIITEKPVDKIVITRAPDFDTLYTAAIHNNRFHIAIGIDLPAGIYQARAGSMTWPFYFSTGDSIHFDINSNRNERFKISGNRIAENKYLQNVRPNNYFLTYNIQNYTPDTYSAEVLREYYRGVKLLTLYKTPEKIKPSEDFINFEKRLLAVRMLSLLDLEYPRAFAVYNPNEELKYPSSVSKLRSNFRLEDTTLLSSTEYLDYLSGSISYKSESSANRDSAALRYISDSITVPQIRDAVLYAGLTQRMNYIRDSATRNSLLAAALPLISRPATQEKLIRQSERLNKLTRGKQAPDFSAESLTGKKLRLKDLGNRYLVIDLWATWCGPCKREEPFFNELANRYTNDLVGFISISLDEEKTAWLHEAPSKSKRVMQLWAANASEDFSKMYGVQSIPRFMLIAPRGRIINSQMPMPSDPDFESILEKEIPASVRYN